MDTGYLGHTVEQFGKELKISIEQLAGFSHCLQGESRGTVFENGEFFHTLRHNLVQRLQVPGFQISTVVKAGFRMGTEGDKSQIVACLRLDIHAGESVHLGWGQFPKAAHPQDSAALPLCLNRQLFRLSIGEGPAAEYHHQIRIDAPLNKVIQ